MWNPWDELIVFESCQDQVKINSGCRKYQEKMIRLRANTYWQGEINPVLVFQS